MYRAYHSLLSPSNYRIPTRGTSTAVNSDMTTMLQQQQAVLTKNLQKKSFLKKTEQKEFESKLIAVENHINDQITPTSSSGDSFNTWKRVVNRALSVSRQEKSVSHVALINHNFFFSEQSPKNPFNS